MTPQAPKRRSTWMDAFDAQMALWQWYRSFGGDKWMQASYQVNSEYLEEGNKQMVRQLYEAEPRKLFDAAPVFVSREMCEVVDAARYGFDPEPLLPLDLLCTHGFVYFEQPFEIRDRFDTETSIAAFSWAPLLGSKRAHQMGKELMAGQTNDGDRSLLERLAEKDYLAAWSELDKKRQNDPEGRATRR